MKKVIILAITAVILFTAVSCAVKTQETDISDANNSVSSASGAIHSESSEPEIGSSASNATLITDRSSQEVRDLLGMVRNATGNGKILSTYPDITVFLGEVDGATETIGIDMEFRDEKAHIKGDSNFSLKPGQNEFNLTIQNDVAEAAVCFVIYRHSEDNDYYAMAKEKYINAYKFYWLSPIQLKFDYDTTYKHPNGDDIPLCTNFIAVASPIFTNNGINQFSESYPYYERVGDKHYLREPGRGGNLSYIDTILIPKQLRIVKWYLPHRASIVKARPSH